MNTKLTKAQRSRLARLLPGGVPRWVRCYDNGGETADRYTVCFIGRNSRAHGFGYRGMSAAPCHPQGFGLWGDAGANGHKAIDTSKRGFAPAIGRKCHLGTRVPFSALPEACRDLVLSDYREIWKL